MTASKEDWPKFLRELQDPVLQKMIREPRNIPKNRKDARQAGAESRADFVEKEMEELNRQRAYRVHKVNEWFDGQLMQHYPRLFDFCKRHKWQWVFKVMGFRFRADDKSLFVVWQTRPIPYTFCTIKWLWFLKAGINMFWEDHKDPRKKSKIVLPHGGQN